MAVHDQSTVVGDLLTYNLELVTHKFRWFKDKDVTEESPEEKPAIDVLNLTNQRGSKTWPVKE